MTDAESNGQIPPADGPFSNVPPSELETRVARLEATVQKLSEGLAQVLAQQVTPALQQQIHQKILQELAGG